MGSFEALPSQTGPAADGPIADVGERLDHIIWPRQRLSVREGSFGVAFSSSVCWNTAASNHLTDQVRGIQSRVRIQVRITQSRLHLGMAEQSAHYFDAAHSALRVQVEMRFFSMLLYFEISADRGSRTTIAPFLRARPNGHRDCISLGRSYLCELKLAQSHQLTICPTH